MNETVIVIDFETTGLSPAKGARATEVAAVRLVNDQIVDNFHSLINPEMHIPANIERLTGITNAMVKNAPLSMTVMQKLSIFINGAPLVAHNARFDRDFLRAEYDRVKLLDAPPFVCSLTLAKRVYPRAPSYKLQALLEYADIPHSGRFHRALSDAMATANLWVQMKRDLYARHRISRLKYVQLAHLCKLPASEISRQIECWR